jgi:hypothetical protein
MKVQTQEPTSFNASDLNIYNATSSLVRFENQKNYNEKCPNLGSTKKLALYVVVNSKVVGLGPALQV